MIMQQVQQRRNLEGVVADLEGMPDRLLRVLRSEQGAILGQFLIMAAADRDRVSMGTR